MCHHTDLVAESLRGFPQFESFASIFTTELPIKEETRQLYRLSRFLSSKRRSLESRRRNGLHRLPRSVTIQHRKRLSVVPNV